MTKQKEQVLEAKTLAAAEIAILRVVLEGGPILLGETNIRAYVEDGRLCLEYPDGRVLSKSIARINAN
jgi:hypothetical protein